MPPTTNILTDIVPPVELNQCVYSDLCDTEFFKRRNSGLGIKYVISGQENYCVDDDPYEVCQGEMLLVNSTQEYSCFIGKDQNAKGICISISPEIIEDVHRNEILADEELLDNITLHDVKLEALNYVYSKKTSKTTELVSKIFDNQIAIPESLSNGLDFYYLLAEKVVKEQMQAQKQIVKIHAIKKSTRLELYKRVLRAKEIMDETFLKNISLGDIAKPAYLSEYHFLRSFKNVFGISPYQYIIRKRLEHSAVLLKEGKPIAEIAVAAGFANVQAYNKSFKALFKLAPGNFRNKL